jgi:CRP-like cAMP-binding protein
MNPENERFLKFLKNSIRIPDLEWKKMTALLKPLSVDKNEYFIRQGDTPERLALIVSGIFRVFCITESGDDKTLAFRTKGMALAAYTPFLENKSTWYSIQALEKGKLIYLLLDDFKKLSQGNPCWEKITKEYIIGLYIEKEKREKSFLTEDAKTRYLRFKDKYPELEKHIHNFHVASYLGISPVSLSRIRGELKKSAN